MTQRPPRAMRYALTVIKLALVGAFFVLGWATQYDGAATSSGYAGYAVADRPDHLQRVLDAHDCSVTGFADRTTPSSALVRSAQGHLRFVSFETGWRIYTEHAAAALVAVCRDQAPGRQAP